jgi:hypothetical protein
MDVSPAAVPPFEEDKIFPGLAEIPDKRPGFRVFQHRSGGQGDDYVRAVPAMAATALPIPSVFRFKGLFVAQMGQSPQVPADGEYHIPASAPVAPGGPAFRNVFFPPKSRTAVPAGPGGNFDQRFVSKFPHRF